MRCAILFLPLTAWLCSACAGEPCRQPQPTCDGEVRVTCVGGSEKRAACGETAYCNAGACVERAFVLPDDAWPHRDPTEWWYYTGHLAAAAGAWGFQVTIFQYDLGGYDGYMCHVALVDEQAGVHYHTDGITLTPDQWDTDALAVLGCRFVLGGDGRDEILGLIPEGKEADDHPGAWRLELSLTPEKRVVPHGGDGIIPMSTAGGTSYYYSYTRLQATGTLSTPELGPVAVTGQAWMDHQWGDFDIVEFKGWDWWSLQLEDGHEIMLFTFRDWEGQLVSQAGTIVAPDGTLTALEGLDAFAITPRRIWNSTHTDGAYPLDWDILIPQQGWQLQVLTAIDDQEMHNIAQTYWEGSTVISGSRGGAPVSGVGFTELTGYATDFLDP